MRKRLMPILLLIVMSLASFAAFGKDTKRPAPLEINIGDVAPDFTLLAYDGKAVKPVSLHDFRGKKNVLLAFYVFAFTGG